ncbi:glycosylhydrolase-like jelly roll fold domain-containing protein [Paenibacillus sp. LHD-38]|uniref:glycosylhydrolase-like jelly roll fold domain-containing protein n=1 Tax=Paenibacillus sp. LHD-38 TaxID=3072143 RepID=UPI00280D500B|nr:glycosylhydrolase-like jelly roll fold domain-containing protein [Paenibacillus sp. LHD-38]MDQ8734278.1 glycosyl hydrolase [Paenibacillus sp. LHD-38]
MQSKLYDVLTGNEDNYILPFFWQHGEEEEILREEMARIHESGIRAVCVESRPHPDFLGTKWWKDIDVILDEARTRGMRVWILDDDHFPTGHAAGRVKEAPTELRRLFLSESHVDAIGPRDHSSFIVSALPYAPGYSNGGTLFAVVAVKRDPVTGVLTEESIDLTHLVENGMLYWNVPEGYWRIFSLIESEHGGDPDKRDYVNLLVAESVRILIDTVHESFYARYRDDFGDTLAGFFSDEPGFYNDKDTWDFNSKPGKKGVSLPWSKEMFSLMELEFGSDYKKHLPLLWHEGGESMSRMRYSYMNLVSRLYADNFTTQIGDWCRERGVEYIGHVLEDSNVHARLGSGAGHFYRALGGQDMSGLDVVLWQLRPGFDDIPARGFVGEGDSEFFNYGMAKMAVSLAHLDPKKKGRTMAEVFGAYGWAEGLKLMKWLTDHMLVRGVNYFVPHAFSPKEYPDRDCPPHLYARGKNPQFRYYKYLNDYTNRLSHLLSGGTHVATAAVLYHAEAEWSGDYMYFHKPVKELLRNQIDCDVLPCDTIVNEVSVRDGKLVMMNETFECLIVPYSEALPGNVLTRMVSLAEQGLPIFFINGLPSRSSEGKLSPDQIDLLTTNERVEVVPLEELADRLKKSGYYDIQLKDSEPYLRSYHMRHSDMDVFMFFNEHPSLNVDTEVHLPVSEYVQVYDAYTNKVLHLDSVKEGDRTALRLKLEASETIVVIAGAQIGEVDAPKQMVNEKQIMSIQGPWSVSTSTSEQYPLFIPWKEIDKVTDLSKPGLLPSFSGTFRYETNLSWSSASGNRAVIDLGEAFETAEVFLNGVSAGVRISAPYRFELSDLIQEGNNMLSIEVTNTLVKETPDFFSRLGQLEPSGLLGPVRLFGA